MSDQGLKVAEFLLQIKAIELKPQNPFTWASGLRSPIYCDNRKTLSYPEIRDYLREQFCEIIRREYGSPEVIAGVATGGIALGALVAQELNLPFVYVRSEAKKHGLTNMIEGVVEQGQKVVVIEDLVSTGKSSLQAVEALREAGVEVMGLVAIFTYSFDSAVSNFNAKNCVLHTLTKYEWLLEQALNMNYISEADKVALSEWRKDPEQWSAQLQKV
ncbi:MAG: orotate phosphoribosyltransferase [Flavobacteriales bacterium]|nr:orotate phosphoribosyltransferase [Flavobacteriales bacterium]